MLGRFLQRVDQNLNSFAIEIDDVCGIAAEVSGKRSISFIPDSSIENPYLWGGYIEIDYEIPPPYVRDITRVLIPYSTKLSMAEQRHVCAKELVHLFDADLEKTDTYEELQGLIEHLSGTGTKIVSKQALMGRADEIALYHALPILVPPTLLASAKDAGWDANALAERACIPLDFADLAMTEEWVQYVSDRLMP